jgi:hypothetical protein
MTPENTSLFLRAIREVKDFRLKFANTATEIVDKIYSYNTNPNCTCKGAIVDWVAKHEDVANNLLTEFSSQIQQLPPVTPPPPQSHTPPGIQPPHMPHTPPNGNPPNLKIGEHVIIPASPDEYKKLLEQAKTERWIFRGCNVVPSKDNDKDVWIVLFY